LVPETQQQRDPSCFGEAEELREAIRKVKEELRRGVGGTASTESASPSSSATSSRAAVGPVGGRYAKLLETTDEELAGSILGKAPVKKGLRDALRFGRRDDVPQNPSAKYPNADITSNSSRAAVSGGDDTAAAARATPPGPESSQNVGLSSKNSNKYLLRAREVTL